MNKIATFITFGASIVFTLSGCSGSGRKADSAEADTTVVESPRTHVMKRLPDTTYASVEAIRWNVETLMPDVDGRLSSLEDLYAEAPGMMAFRGGPRRDAPQTGSLDSVPSEIVVDWEFRTASDAKWGGGSGWNGQPVYVQWPDSLLSLFRGMPTSTDALSREEIIVGSLCGNVYFIDFATGKASREPIKGANPIKGSVSLDPTLNGNLYVGHGINNAAPFGHVTINLKRHAVTHSFGRDPKAQRGWGAYDSSPVRVGQFLFRPGENGTFYKWFIGDDGTLQLHSTLRFTRNGEAPGIESSLGVYANYGYFGDNKGNFLCVDLDTMKPVWYFNNHDDTDASPVVVEENGVPFVYAACEVDKQDVGHGYLTKLNGLTGEPVWEAKFPGRLARVGEKHFDGGFYGTPLPGRADCEGLIFANLVYNTSGQNGSMVALDTRTGEVKWETPLAWYAWSSPVAFTDKEGHMYIFTGDTLGNAYIISGADGRILAKRNVGNNFESSPIVAGNSVVVGSRGTSIFKMTLK